MSAGAPSPGGASGLDHVLLAVPEPDGAAERLRRDHGLASVPGGAHPAWGTRNRIVPLGASYLELVTVANAGVAANAPFGRLVAGALERGGGLCGWAVALDDLEELAARHGLEVAAGRRPRPGRAPLTWRIAGIERALADPSLPFLITWDDPADHPGRLLPPGVPAGRIARLDVGGSPKALADWLGGSVRGVSANGGPAGVQAVEIVALRGTIRLDAAAARSLAGA